MKLLPITVVLAIGLSACSSSSSSTASSDPSASKTVKVTRARMEQTIKARGIVKPAPTALVRVGFPMPKDVSRRIKRLTVVEGSNVKAGDVIAELDSEDLQASIQQLHTDAEVAQQQLEALRELQPSEVAVAEAVVVEAKAQLDLAQKNKERLDSLLKEQIIARQAWDTGANDLQVASARHRRAEVTLENIRAKFRTDISTAEARLRTAKAAADNLGVQLRWSVLHAPIDAQVFAVHQRQGELTSNQPSAPVVTLLDLSGLQLHLYVDEADVGRIAIGQKATFRLDAHPDKTLGGRIVRILPQPILQENVVYYLAVVEPETAERKLLRSEMTALGYVQLGAREGVMRLPLSAVKSRSNGWYATRVDAGGPVEIAVQIGWKDESGVEIREGLQENDVVLLAP